jgi:hypothetical protein
MHNPPSTQAEILFYLVRFEYKKAHLATQILLFDFPPKKEPLCWMSHNYYSLLQT